jgi:hypothetical protein
LHGYGNERVEQKKYEIIKNKKGVHSISVYDQGVTKGRNEKRNGNGKRKDIQYQHFKYYTLNKNTLYSLKASEDIFTTTQIVSFGGLQKK